ncbi:MAG: bifunctional phosphopantothenoylcysteine decarboxylase/phosphopantothenate--cysteine ligase CoaBC [Thermodesulfobacteriota bacterium]
MEINGKRIVLGVCGGIAAYKSVELLRLLVKQGARVRVVMTQYACDFVAPLTFEALSGQKVCTSLFDNREDASIRHIEWARETDAVIIAPATANILGKLAAGIADDALSTFMLAVTAPRMLCPSMNSAMYENRAVQRNLDVLEQDGYVIVEPGTGELACGTSGVGRMPEPEIIFDRLRAMLSPKDLAGKTVLVTAGPTCEAIDPVRFISNRSSGKMGYALAAAAEYRGADVVLITGPTNLAPPVNVETVAVESAQQMADEVFARMAGADIIIKVAAVADYRAKAAADRKIKKNGKGTLALTLVENIDILKEIGTRKKKKQVVVGFAAETHDLAKNARAKLAAKKADLLVANPVAGDDTAFGADTNQATLFYKDGAEEPLPRMRKTDLANAILNRVLKLALKES